MNTLTIESPARALKVVCTEDELTVSLSDGRVLSVPLVWFPRLLNASKVQRDKYELIGDGTGIYWPQVDEDISVAGLLSGTPSIEVRRGLAER